MTTTSSRLLVVLGLPGEMTRSFLDLLEISGTSSIGSAGLELGHRQLLAQAGTDCLSVSSPADRWFAGEAAMKGAKLLQQELSVATSKADSIPIQLLQQPGMERLLPLWQQALDRLDLRPSYLLLLRHPLEVAADLAREKGFSRDHALMVWLRSTLGMEGATRDQSRCVVELDCLHWDPDVVLDRLEHALPLELPERSHSHSLQWERAQSHSSSQVFLPTASAEASPLLRMALELHTWLKAEANGEPRLRLMPEVICEQLAWAEALYGRTLADEQQQRRQLEQELQHLKSSRLMRLRRLWHRQDSGAAAA